MKAYLSIPDWDKLQHYKDRTPPWIKLHNELLESYEFECLPDASKAHLLCIWLLASRTGNKINPDPRWIGRKIGANSKVDIDILVESGFLQLNQPLQTVEQDASKPLQTVEQDASKPLQTVEQDACPEREQSRVEEEVERESEQSTAIAESAKPDNSALEIFKFWLDVMRKNMATTKFTAKRKKAVDGRLKDGYTPEEIQRAIVNCANSPFHMGQNERNTKYNDIELICRADKFEQFRDNVGQQQAPRQMSAATERTVNNIIDVELD